MCEVIISIESGIPRLVAGPKDAHILVVDYDVEGGNLPELTDAFGRDCFLYCLQGEEVSLADASMAERYYWPLHNAGLDFGEVCRDGVVDAG